MKSRRETYYEGGRYDKVKKLLVVLRDPFMYEDDLGVQCNSAGIE